MKGERKPRWFSPLRDLELLVLGKEPADLLERLGWNDEIARRARRSDLIGISIFARRWPFVATIRIVSGLQLPEHAVEDRPALLGANRERRVRDQLLEIAGANAPALVEAHVRKAGNSSRGSPRILKCDATAIERHALLAGGGDPHRRRRELARDLAEFLGRDRDRARRLDVGRDLGRHGDVEVGAGEPNAFVGRLDQDVREHRQGRLRRNARGHRGKTFLQLFPGDRKPHHRSSGVVYVQNGAALLVLSLKSN